MTLMKDPPGHSINGAYVRGWSIRLVHIYPKHFHRFTIHDHLNISFILDVQRLFVMATVFFLMLLLLLKFRFTRINVNPLIYFIRPSETTVTFILAKEPYCLVVSLIFTDRWRDRWQDVY